MKTCAACGRAPAKKFSRQRWLCTSCARIDAAPMWRFATYGGSTFAAVPGRELIDAAVEEMARG